MWQFLSLMLIGGYGPKLSNQSQDLPWQTAEQAPRGPGQVFWCQQAV